MNRAEDLFFPLMITDGSDFQKNKSQRCKLKMKNEVKNFYFGDHIRTWTVISKKKKRSSPCFPISVRPAGSTVFLNLALRVKSLPTPDLALRNKYQKKKCEAISASKRVLTFPYRGYATKF